MRDGTAVSDDRQEVTDLVAAYAVLLDREVIDEWLALFTEDATFEAFGRTFSGHDGLRKMATSAPGGIHMGSLPLIDLDGDRGTVRQSFVFVEAASHQLRVGWYDDEVVRTGGGWRFRSRRTTFRSAGGAGDRPE